MYALLTILILLASILLIGVVLIQKSKGGGLASNFASSNQIMGVRKTTDFVEKATWTLAITVCVLSILTAFVAPRDLVTGKGSRVTNAPKQEQQATPVATEKQAPAPVAAPAAAPEAPAQGK